MTRKDDHMMAWVSLVHAGTYLPARLSNHLEDELGITLAEQDLMNQLSKSGGEIQMRDLADALFLSRAGVTRMVDRLEEAGWLNRVPVSGDRRAMSAQLTPGGRDLLKRSRTVLRRWIGDNFAAHLSEEDTRHLGSALKHLLEGLGRWEGQLAHLDRGPTSS